MSENRQHRWSRTPPAGPQDASGDLGNRRAGDAAPEDEAGGHTAKQQRPGIGREEQARPHRPPPHRPRPERESDDR
ncbi:hypothetical protein QEZ40_006657 [Streptomyces katrae]|uniref:Uncharacterized protein n=1 Tax=Streptomyces katrae TaxID=68223 RepID=A0ABT7GQN9_9ACTN|nr:hypothetical protein [Streptomyces katrae]MDK9495629.1 hypothetical protein [Streptomyces katrae]